MSLHKSDADSHDGSHDGDSPLNSDGKRSFVHSNNNDDYGDDDKPGKKRRTNYRRPENAAKLNAAVNALIMQKQDPNAPKDIRSVSKIFNIPYNTLRDNYLRVTTGDVRCSKRPKKKKDDDDESDTSGGKDGGGFNNSFTNLDDLSYDGEDGDDPDVDEGGKQNSPSAVRK